MKRSFGLSSPSDPSQAGSQQRQQDLNSLQDYMQRCTNKLYWLDQQAKDRTHYDWSDHNLDYPSRRRQYEVRAMPGPVSAGCFAAREVGTELGSKLVVGWGQEMPLPPPPQFPPLHHEAL